MGRSLSDYKVGKTSFRERKLRSTLGSVAFNATNYTMEDVVILCPEIVEASISEIAKFDATKTIESDFLENCADILTEAAMKGKIDFSQKFFARAYAKKMVENKNKTRSSELRDKLCYIDFQPTGEDGQSAERGCMTEDQVSFLDWERASREDDTIVDIDEMDLSDVDFAIDSIVSQRDDLQIFEKVDIITLIKAGTDKNALPEFTDKLASLCKKYKRLQDDVVTLTLAALKCQVQISALFARRGIE